MKMISWKKLQPFKSKKEKVDQSIMKVSHTESMRINQQGVIL